ncbi:hypothetical protein MRQ36_00825 [Micromonospora sp. R77]|uniref:hypothetical protein n=1 Tax=Micromonospora sp. R77 TaxID=2925836 RepID=UPI001F6213D2|nr:hypothetical protein [Micromonospora sp. R77]MCI4061191.1 hypothetical protein [Micromonospora sp. R77]
MLFFLSAAAVGVGVLILMTAGTGAGTWFGITFCGLLVLGSAVGGRWGRGPVARGVRAPLLATAGVALLGLCAVAGIMLVWRPSVGAGLPMVPFLLCMAIGSLLMVPVGVMGDEADERRE